MSEPALPPASLLALQRWMLHALTATHPVKRDELEHHFISGPQLGPAACFAIYQRAFAMRLITCLAEQFPALGHAIGHALFHDFAADYLRAHPPVSTTLHDLGRRFPAWLESSRPDRDRPDQEREDWIDFMVDLAGYERELFRMFDAPGHEGEPWPRREVDDRQLVLQPCFSLAVHRYPVAWYYHAVRAGGSPAFPRQQTSYVAIARRDYQTSTFSIQPLHFRFLAALQAGGSVTDALSELAAHDSLPLDVVARSWAREVRGPWIDAGFFIERAIAGHAHPRSAV